MSSPLKKVVHVEYFDLEGKVCAEIGTLRGDWAAQLVKSRPARLYLIDCWEAQPSDLYLDRANIGQQEQDAIFEGVKARFAPYESVEIIRKFSAEAHGLFAEEFFDFVYVDANHSFEACYQDLSWWFPKVKRGGLLAGHDYSSKHPGVVEAVQLFCQKNGLSCDMLTRKSWGILKP
jgi:hypothetical protein